MTDSILKSLIDDEWLNAIASFISDDDEDYTDDKQKENNTIVMTGVLAQYFENIKSKPELITFTVAGAEVNLTKRT